MISPPNNIWNYRGGRVLAAALAAALAFAGLAGNASAAPGDRSLDGAWGMITDAELASKRAVANADPWTEPAVYQPVELDHAAMIDVLSRAPMEFSSAARSAPATMTLPRPDGSFEAFDVVESPIMAPELAAWLAAEGYPMKTYKLKSLDNPASTGRVDFGGPFGLHAYVSSPDGAYLVNPRWRGDDQLHVSFFRSDYPRGPKFECKTPERSSDFDFPVDVDASSVERGGSFNMRTLRLAVSATGEYTTYHGGSAALGQAAIVTMVNRMNEIYERDAFLRFLIVAGNQNVVFTNAGSDPYSTFTGGNEQTLMNQCRDRLNMASPTGIGSANYDIGHLVSQGGDGGIAGEIGNACVNTVNDTHKGRGYTSTGNPIGDPWTIDYVAHELGHQLGAEHTWNSCGFGSGHGLAVEPGSGVTVMGYAGICGSDDQASNSDAMFHNRSIAQIVAYVGGAGCFGTIATGNGGAPVLDAGLNRSIPLLTPFELTATGFSDSDGDSLTFSWEQNDSGDIFGSQASLSGSAASTTGPVYRTHLPTASPTRVFPPIANVIAGSTPPLGDRLATQARTLNFRCMARDNNSEVGRTAFDSVTITTVNTGSAFAVTAPNGGGTLSGAITVTWNVAGTSGGAVNTPNVDIFLSTDGGNTYPTTLATAVTNDGSQGVVLPNITTSTARIKVKGNDNYFFDISNANFSITPGVPTPQFQKNGMETLDDVNPGFANGNGVIEPDEEGIELTFPIQNFGTGGATGVAGTLVSMTPTATVVNANASWANLGIGATGSNLTPFTIDVSPAHGCGDPINLQLNMSSNEGGATSLNYSFPTGMIVGGTPLPTQGFEGGALPAGWSTAVSPGFPGTNRWAVRTDASSAGVANGGTFLASFEPTNSLETDVRLITPAVTGAMELTFFHAYDVEQDDASVGFDGLQIQVSTNGGSSWTTLNSEISAGSYTHTADGGFGSPLSAGAPIWSGASPSFPAMNQVTVDLSAFSAQNINIAFRYTEDDCCSGGESGWFIDDVTITGGTPMCDPVPVELSGFELE